MPRKNARPLERKVRAKLLARMEAQGKVKVMDKHPKRRRGESFAALLSFLLRPGAR